MGASQNSERIVKGGSIGKPGKHFGHPDKSDRRGECAQYKIGTDGLAIGED
jgi:hypothetical protein